MLYRRIALGNHVSLALTLEPRQPGALPHDCRFMGSAAAVAPLRCAWGREDLLAGLCGGQGRVVQRPALSLFPLASISASALGCPSPSSRQRLHDNRVRWQEARHLRENLEAVLELVLPAPAGADAGRRHRRVAH